MDRAAAYEQGLDAAARRAGGVHYTPADVADEVVAMAMDGVDGAPVVCDPTCGGGALLLAAGRALEQRGLDRRTIVEHHLWGADIDPQAVAIAGDALSAWSGADCPHLSVADSLVAPPTWPAFDLVMGNPPFLNQLQRATVRAASGNDALQERFGDAVRPYTDTAWLFLLVAADLAAPDGRIALIQPQSLLGARDAAVVRSRLSARGQVVAMWVDGTKRFGAAVDVCAPIIELGTPGGEEWATWLSAARGVPPVDATTAGRVGDLATALVGFRDQYYGLVSHVAEHVDVERGAPLVTAGLIDLGSCAWGERLASFAKRRWKAPVVDLDSVDGKAADWVARQRVPKVVVATQTKVIEAAVDLDGAWIASVPTIAVIAPPSRLRALLAAICSPAATALAFHRAAGTGLSHDTIRLSAAAVLDLPLPADRHAWAHGTDRLAAGDLVAYADAMAAAYGIDDGGTLAGWWHARR